MQDSADDYLEFNDDGQPHYMLAVIDMAVRGCLSPERERDKLLGGERMLLRRCLDSFFGPRFRHVDLDVLIPLSNRSRDEIVASLPALLRSLIRFGKWNPDRAPTHIILDGELLNMEEAAKRWPPHQD